MNAKYLLKSYYWEKLMFSNVQFWGAPTHADIIEF